MDSLQKIVMDSKRSTGLAPLRNPTLPRHIVDPVEVRVLEKKVVDANCQEEEEEGEGVDQWVRGTATSSFVCPVTSRLIYVVQIQDLRKEIPFGNIATIYEHTNLQEEDEENVCVELPGSGSEIDDSDSEGEIDLLLLNDDLSVHVEAETSSPQPNVSSMHCAAWLPEPGAELRAATHQEGEVSLNEGGSAATKSTEACFGSI